MSVCCTDPGCPPHDPTLSLRKRIEVPLFVSDTVGLTPFSEDHSTPTKQLSVLVTVLYYGSAFVSEAPSGPILAVSSTLRWLASCSRQRG
jgi:hypothetical protein